MNGLDMRGCCDSGLAYERAAAECTAEPFRASLLLAAKLIGTDV